MASSFDVFFLIKVLKILNVCEALELLPSADIKTKHVCISADLEFPIK